MRSEIVEEFETIPTITYGYLIPFGYAGGCYECVCNACGEHFIGDKRASTCEDCARDMLEEENMA
jgi:hypothetical protein